MKKMLQDRKTLYLVLCMLVVSVFTLSIAYAVMSAVLEIHGNSEVVASSWDIHLDNVKVKNGSVSANAPQISGTSTLGFDVELNKPGDYYVFTVDVVNDGSIDAMIDSVVKTPELTSEQAKYIKYEITYENGESISTKQTLKKGTSTPIKVRVEYRKDIVASDLPSSATVLSLKLTLVYVQSDGTGNTITNNGSVSIAADGNINDIGTIITIGSEQFYTIGTEGNNVKLFAKNTLGLAEFPLQYVHFRTTPFSTDEQKGANYTDYSGSVVEGYVNNYNSYLITQGVTPIESRLITKDELINLGCSEDDRSCIEAPSWVYAHSYWTCTEESGQSNYLYAVYHQGPGWFYGNVHSDGVHFGVRPVIVISKSYF